MESGNEVASSNEKVTQITPNSSKTETSEAAEHTASHQRLVFADPAAFRCVIYTRFYRWILMVNRYLEEDPSTTVLERQRRLPGYELYLVEQWACSRVHPTFVITTFTGLEQHSILVSVLSVPTNEELWSPRLRVYLKAITKFHARKKETPIGILMVTNLNGFPSALNVIAVPDGDVRKHRSDFIVNENLKRMGCSGRAGLNLSPPIGATQAKFLRLYKTSDRVPIYSAVIELVKLCQLALLLFGKLAFEYADGLLCDVTEQAVNDWWTEIGTDFFDVEPNDGILGPTTVAALLGILLGARNRLNACGAPVGKDVFDLANTKRGIASFQKSQKLERSRRFDQQTLDRLRRVSAKAASGQGWMVPRAVKSTVAELSGKGGDVIINTAGTREKIGIADIETLEIDTFIRLAYGERCKWLWHGKPRKAHDASELLERTRYEDGLVFNNPEQESHEREGSRRQSMTDESPRHMFGIRDQDPSAHGLRPNPDVTDKDTALRRTVLKSVTGRITDARTGFGRIKDAVGKTGFRGHHHKFSRDTNMISDGESAKEIREGNRNQPSATDSDAWVSRSKPTPQELEDGDLGRHITSRQGRNMFDEQGKPEEPTHNITQKEELETDAESSSSLDTLSRIMRLQLSAQRDAFNLPPKNSEKMQPSLQGSDALPLLRTSQSLSNVTNHKLKDSYGYRFARHLSFSAVVDVISAFDPKINEKFKTTLPVEDELLFDTNLLGSQLHKLRVHTASWAEQKVDQVSASLMQAELDQERLDHLCRQKLEEYHALKSASEELTTVEKSSLTKSFKEIENLGAKLEYELTALQSKVEDVENGIDEFERQVLRIERRAEELQEESTDRDSWLRWAVNWVTGQTKPVD